MLKNVLSQNTISLNFAKALLEFYSPYSYRFSNFEIEIVIAREIFTYFFKNKYQTECTAV